MSENPYAAYPSNRDDFGDSRYDGQQRLSIPAVLSLVSSLICCIPGLGVLAVLLGLLGMVSISRSNGRLTGMPAAIVGMALGVLVTVGWVALAVGAGSGLNFWATNITPPLSRMVEAAYDGDVDAFRAEMTVDGAGLITDDEILRFGQAMRAEFGEYRGMPDSLDEWFQALGEGFGRSGGQFQGSAQEAVPTVLFTDAGGIAVFGVFDPGGQPSQMFRYKDLFVLLPNQEVLVLRDDGPATNEAIKLNFTPVTTSELLERKALGGSSGAPAPADDSTDAETETESEMQ
ncbi:MAG: hypothetical protein ACTS27_05570 [Phycisphaerales bacterium]